MHWYILEDHLKFYFFVVVQHLASNIKIISENTQ